jgi:hypothetical protein
MRCVAVGSSEKVGIRPPKTPKMTAFDPKSVPFYNFFFLSGKNN